MDIRFDGKRVLVTGAGRGIGRDTALYLAELGAKVLVVSRQQEGLDSLKKEAPDIDTYQLDITDWEKTEEVIKQLLPIDLLVNNAGIVLHSEILQLKQDTIHSVIDTNLIAAMHITQIVAKSMIEMKSPGAIVNVSSTLDTMCQPLFGTYSASKAGLGSFTRSCAVEFGPHQIRVNAVCPGAVMTESLKKTLQMIESLGEALTARTPLGRMTEPREVSHVIAFLLSDKASMINGVTLPIDGGHHCT